MYSMTGQRRYRPLLRLIGSSQIIQDSRNTVFQDLLADHRNGSKFAGALERRDKGLAVCRRRPLVVLRASASSL